VAWRISILAAEASALPDGAGAARGRSISGGTEMVLGAGSTVQPAAAAPASTAAITHHLFLVTI
jgi:hypothetical protein